MLESLRDFLKRTPIYRPYQRIRFWNQMEQDEKAVLFYKQFISPGDLVFDVGANMGGRVRVFYKLGAQVVAFEPQVDCFDYLDAVFSGTKSVRIVNRALGRAEGEAEMFISDASLLSSLSARWMEAVKASGRFGERKWEAKKRVKMTTLDKAIQEFGIPKFIKIDVEGYESEVLSGLSTPIECLSIEFTPEDIGNTLNCLDHMGSLSAFDARHSLGESMEWATPSWLTADKIKQVFVDADPKAFGDVYIRCLRA